MDRFLYDIGLHHERVNQSPLVVLLKYVLTCFIVENDHSNVALVAGRTKRSFASLVTSGNNIFWVLFIPRFTNESNNFVADILRVSKKAAN